MAIIRLDDVNDYVSKLLGDAAKRQGMMKHSFIIKQLEKVADKEHELQLKEKDGE